MGRLLLPIPGKSGLLPRASLGLVNVTALDRVTSSGRRKVVRVVCQYTVDPVPPFLILVGFIRFSRVAHSRRRRRRS